MPPPPCSTCRFDAGLYRDVDVRETLRVTALRWRHHVDGLPDDVVEARPAGGWSVVDHAARARDVTAATADLLTAVLGDAPPVASLVLPDPPSGGEPVRDVLAGIDAAADRLLAAMATLDGDGWRRTAVLDGEPVDAADLVRRAVHATEHHTVLAGRAARAAGAGASTATGSVLQVNVSDGGVPKLPVDGTAVRLLGLEGDRRKSVRHHGRPWQAVSLWSAERIDALRAEGHDLAPGAAGENVTVAGVDWSAVRPGVQLRVGDALLAVSAYAVPCHKIAALFVDRDLKRVHHARHPGWSRVYASVLEEGDVRAGDPVVVEP